MRWFFVPWLYACSQAAPSSDRLASPFRESDIEIYASASKPSFTLGDVDGDGVRDLIVAFGEPDTDRGLALRLGNGHGFGESQRILFGTASFTLFDVDADGRDDIILSDGQNLGLLPSAKGPMQVLAKTRDAIVFADHEGIVTSSGPSLFTRRAWTGDERTFDVTPLDVRAALDANGDGALDLAGLTYSCAAVRLHGESSVHLLGRADDVTASNGFVIGWSGEDAALWRGTSRDPVRVVTIPQSTIAMAATDRTTIAATRNRITILGEREIAGPWKDIHQIVLEDETLYVSDWTLKAIARVRLN